MNKKHQLFLAEQQKKAAKPVVEETVVDELVEEAKEEPETVRSLREQKFDDLSVETYVKEDLHQED